MGAQEGSPDVRGRRVPGARPRFRGFENFPARVPWRRAAAEPDPRGRASRGELSASRRRVTLAFRRASPWAALRPPAPSLLARTVPAPPLWARSARPGRWRRRPSPPPPPGSPARRSSRWPSPVPRADGRRARSAAPAPGGWERGGEGGGDPPRAAGGGCRSRLFANGPARHVQVASLGGGGGGAGAADGRAGERGARGGARSGGGTVIWKRS